MDEWLFAAPGGLNDFHDLRDWHTAMVSEAEKGGVGTILPRYRSKGAYR